MAEREYRQLTFTATLTREPDSTATFLTVPYDIFQEYGLRGRVPVAGTLNGKLFRGSIFPYGGVHYLGVNRDLRESTGLKAGDLVDVVLDYDPEPRVVVLPADLEAALAENVQARKNWKRLAYSHQKEYVDAIEDAKKPETRRARVISTVKALTEIKYYEKKK